MGVARQAADTSADFAHVDVGYETMFRTLSPEHYDEFLRTGRMPGTTETFTSPTRAFSDAYDGVLIEFQLKPGTLDRLREMGVRAHGKRNAALMPDLPEVRRNWGRTKALFKAEGDQVNIGLGTGLALDEFNNSIAGFKVLRAGKARR